MEERNLAQKEFINTLQEALYANGQEAMETDFEELTNLSPCATLVGGSGSQGNSGGQGDNEHEGGQA